MVPLKPVVTYKVVPLRCPKCKVLMLRNYEKLCYVCPLCKRETDREER